MIDAETLLRHSISLVVIGMIHDFLFGGVIYGWSSLVVALKNEGVYSYACGGNNGTQLHIAPVFPLALQERSLLGDDDSTSCNDQELKLAVIYTVSSFSNTCAAVVMGLFLDRYGPRKTAILGGLVGMMGSLLFAFSTNSFDAFIPGMVFISLGGPAVHISHMHVAFLFTGKHAQITSLFSGIFAASAFVFFVFLALSQHANVTLRSMFIAYTLILFFILVTGYLSSPTQSFDVVLARGGQTLARQRARKKSEIEELLGAGTSGVYTEVEIRSPTGVSSPPTSTSDTDIPLSPEPPSTPVSAQLPRPPSQIRYIPREAENGPTETLDNRLPPPHPTSSSLSEIPLDSSSDFPSVPPQRLFNAPLRTQLLSGPYILIVVFLSLHVLRQNCYLGTLHLQLGNLGDEKLAYLSTFGVIFPVFGSVTSIVSGPIYDRTGVHTCMNIVNILAILWSITGAIHNLPVQIVTFVVFGVCNNFTYMVIWSSVGKIFGFANFGTLAALLTLTSAIFGLFIYPFLYITTELLDSNFLPGNILLLLFVLPFLGFHLYYYREEIRGEIYKQPRYVHTPGIVEGS